MFKDKVPYTINKGEKVMVTDGDLRTVDGIRWDRPMLQYEIKFNDGTSIFCSKIKTVPVWIN